MIDAGILDGDLAVIERCDTADDGAIVVALIDDEEATLKRLRRLKSGPYQADRREPRHPPHDLCGKAGEDPGGVGVSAETLQVNGKF